MTGPAWLHQLRLHGHDAMGFPPRSEYTTEVSGNSRTCPQIPPRGVGGEPKLSLLAGSEGLSTLKPSGKTRLRTSRNAHASGF